MSSWGASYPRRPSPIPSVDSASHAAFRHALRARPDRDELLRRPRLGGRSRGRRRRPVGRPGAAPRRRRGRRRARRRDPRDAHALGSPARPRRARGRDAGAGLRAPRGARAPVRPRERRPPGARRAARPGAPRRRRRHRLGRRHRLRGRRRPRPHGRPSRLLHRGRALLRRRPLRGLRRAHRSPGPELGRPPHVDRNPDGALPAGDGGLLRPRSRNDARRRARPQPVPGGAARVSASFQAPRGTHDVLPDDERWWHLVRTIEDLAPLYGWRRIQTPGFEDTGLFARTAGEASDVVHKEMYTFTDRGERSLTLRPEGTAPIARAYVEHGMHREPQPVKAYTIAPMYRYGKPGRGRYREHWQLSLEAIGSADPAIDAEVVQFYVELLRRLGVTEWELRLNSIGDPACRPAYVERLNEWLDANEDVLDEDARHKRATSPLQVFDVKNETVRAALDAAPKITDSLCDDCRAHFDAVRSHLDGYGVPYVVDPFLVRGLDYYTRTAFEFVGPEENVNSTICGGGRYDGLVEAIGGPPTPGIGFGAGIERLLLAVEREGLTVEPRRLDVFFVVEPGAPREQILEAMAELRRRGIACDTDYAGRSLKGQFTQAGRVGARATVVVRADGATVRRAGEGDAAVALDDLVARLSAS